MTEIEVIPEPIYGGSPTPVCLARMEKHAKNKLKICEHIDSDPCCSCAKCDAQVVTRSNGNIVCCNRHLFTLDEIANARRYIVPVEVPYHAR